jgi:ABC-2 type transport system permease protein
MTPRGIAAVARVERRKLAGQMKTRGVLAACALAPFAFVWTVNLQNNLPEDTLFGRAVKESGFATPLVILGFAALWMLPALTAVVGGDLFSAEDRFGTWPSVLTRSRSRAEVFWGKVTVALAFSCIEIALLGAASIAAGVLVVGAQPLVDLSGALEPPGQALRGVALSWLSVLPAAWGFTAVAVLLSVWTRSSAAGVGVPVVAGLIMQLLAAIDGADVMRRLLLTSGFVAWRGLLTDRPYYGPLVVGTMVSAAYVFVCLAAAFVITQRRDIGG